ncbi:conserved hypothetical protein [Talaromyces stipitatus ATCC 10500]|uniref:Zn(2)-C6 fungal-type domain-containing protein n=1 Tax=Talaromyces stipitatus (strain ATCC 10500 / CBS 375.48 / QM 6759 / NRRL 1006) TaxID=441959 RepID=B8MFS3_TALSN|nr:uncharacterized protein TSTA_021240 [Talaromyces stipitatus ATCC 10500]EED17063.1 conserved hypothetical protein [Talaromyces stipitatus ATCC 10500]
MNLDDTRFICPRPRAVRACASCKVHKTRCLPSARSDQCRRCEKIGTICLYNDIQQSKNKPQVRLPEKEKSALNSILAQVLPAALDINYEDQSEKVFQIHGNLFGCPETAKSTTPQSQANQPDDKPREKESSTKTFKRPHVTMKEVDEMLQSYHQRNVCFPFVAIPKNTTAEKLCQKWQFLVLSILVISSGENPILQKCLDERFRKVLATRVIMQGEKSLDYVHGLLVYLAWHPTHLRPINNQIFQYLQLAISMIADLDLERKMYSTTDPIADKIVARNTVLGCYFLSANIAMGFRRPNNFRFAPPDELLSSMLLSGNDSVEQVMASTVLLCRFIEKLYGLKIQADMEKLASWTECPLQNLTRVLRAELTQLETELPAHVYTNRQIQIMRRFARIKIHSLALEQKKHISYIEINPLTYLEVFPTCASEINGLLEYIVNTPRTEYRNFSITDWEPIIHTVIIFPKLCRFTIPDLSTATTWQDMLLTEIPTYLTHIDQLCERLQEASITRHQTDNDMSSSHKLPDLFFLFYTVLKLFKDNFARESAHYSISASPASLSGNKPARSRCPVVNGDIQDTEYWTMWMNTNNLMSDVEMFGLEGDPFSGSDINDLAVFDLNSWVDFSA